MLDYIKKCSGHKYWLIWTNFKSKLELVSDKYFFDIKLIQRHKEVNSIPTSSFSMIKSSKEESNYFDLLVSLSRVNLKEKKRSQFAFSLRLYSCLTNKSVVSCEEPSNF